jgi:hypothetical protein
MTSGSLESILAALRLRSTRVVRRLSGRAGKILIEIRV